MIDEPVELELRYWPDGPPEVMFGHFFVVAAFEELEELFELLEDEELVFVAEALTPDEALVFGSV